MAIYKEDKEQILKTFRRSELDTGSSEVQVALLTARIKDLTGHFQSHKKDFSSRKGLVKMVNRRRKLLDYIRKTEPQRYNKLINDLGLRK
jgi:small subunit ribosomal protein S15